jgi:hypothetical protein
VVVRRVIASTLLSLGLLCGTLAMSAWWLQRTAFDTSHTSDVAEAALQNPELRSDLARAIADRVAIELNLDHAAVESAAQTALVRPDIATAFSGVLRDVHARLIGEATGPVSIPPDLVVRATGNPAAAQLPAVTFDIPTFSALDTTRRTLKRAIPLLIYAAAVLVVLGLVLHPWKPAALRTIGVWLLGASVFELVVAYTLPVLVLPALVDSPYAELVAEVDKATIGPLVGVLVMMAGAGVGCLVAGAWLDRPNSYTAEAYRW